MSRLLNLAVAFAIMLLLFVLIGLGAMGTIELTLWAALTVLVLGVTAMRSRPRKVTTAP